MPNIIQIQDITLPELEVYAALKHRGQTNESFFLAESGKVIEYALNAGCIPLSFLMEQRCVEGQAKEIIARCNCPVYTGERTVLAQLTGFALDRGFLCAMSRPQDQSLEQVCANAHRVAVLDRLKDPTDVGAIFRSAAALGIDAVVLTERCPDPLYRRCVRVSMGSVFLVPWARAENDALQQLRRMGFQTAVLSSSGMSIEDPALAGVERLAILLSDHPSIENGTFPIHLPMVQQAEPLNMASASAVVFWQLRGK